MDILLVEDNLDLQATLGDYLSLQGCTVDFANNVALALRLIKEQTFDVIVLDVMLPDGTGLDICHQVRTELACQTPILFLSARDTLDDKLLGFQQGADDYLTKPFDMQELLVRIKALYARGNRTDIGFLEQYGVRVDRNTTQVTRDDQAITLNPTEFKILSLLMRRSPNVVSKAEIEREIWQDEPPDSDALRSHIYRLRTKLDKPFVQPLIHNIHGIGFQFSTADKL